MKIPIVPWGTQTKQARSKLNNEGQIPEGLLRDHIERSWQRCVGQGLDPSRTSPLDPIGRAELREAQERNLVLLSEAKPLMESLHEQISGSGSMVILTDPAGLIVHSLGDPEFISKAQRVALRPGVSWAEGARGTNAIGTAAVEQAPVVVHAGEHFLERNAFLTCSAAPIFDPQGRLAGVLDISGDQRCYHKHTLALVRLTAKMIERRLVLSQHGNELLVHLHRIPEFAGTLCEGVMAFSEAGRILGATHCAFTELGISPDTMHQHSFATLFDMPLEAALGQAMRGGLHSVPLEPRPGYPMFATVQVGPGLSARRLSVPVSAQAYAPVEAVRARTEEAPAGFDSLTYGDAHMAVAIERARRVLGRDIAILIEGESGVGKELFAKAFHASGPRRDGPFVAVNCAAIPEGLIESELFGYDEGAFTGARRRGASGRIQQADGGTLFLDEIGDMPFALQSRLLRVLQDRTITPLGSGRSYRVDLSLVCATHRKLRDEVARGNFREDLYYRLNGLRFSLPPLRDRTDLPQLVDALLRQEAGDGQPMRVSAEAMAVFRRYPWPGNIRQLANVLRASLALVGDDGEIRVSHLPDDFLEEVEEIAAAGAEQKAVAAIAPDTIACAGNLEELEARAIRKALDENAGNVSAAARQLGISRNTLYRKLGRF